MQVSTLTIEKRQTGGKTDVAYCVINLKNDFYQCTKYITLYYNYYDKGGWILDNWSPYQDSVCTIIKNPYQTEEITADLLRNYDSAKYVDCTLDIAKGSVKYSYNVEKKMKYKIISGLITEILLFDGRNWNKKFDNSALSDQWDIVGTWELEKAKSGQKFSLVIDSFDQNTMKATGSCHYKYTYDMGWSSLTDQCDHDLEDADICINGGALVIKWGRTGIYINSDDADFDYESASIESTITKK